MVRNLQTASASQNLSRDPVVVVVVVVDEHMNRVNYFSRVKNVKYDKSELCVALSW